MTSLPLLQVLGLLLAVLPLAVGVAAFVIILRRLKRIESELQSIKASIEVVAPEDGRAL